MILHKHAARFVGIPSCHGGTGTLQCTEYLGDYDRPSSGFTFVHDNLLPPGASIGVHTHSGDEELYVFLDGIGTMTMNGATVEVHPGDICLTRSGESHSLFNSGTIPIHFLVVGTKLESGSSR
ncbi:MAG: cupin domain-containing protein [Bacteroidetes bacterium]|nr:cupin domain-containing protein [Bacteroidota bacterium]